MRTTVFVIALASLFPLIACAKLPEMSSEEKLALYSRYAGEPVKSVRVVAPRFAGWTPISDTAAALWVKRDEAYLLRFYGYCENMKYTGAIGVTSRMGRVFAKLDHVVGPGIRSCRIDEIRKLDLSAA